MRVSCTFDLPHTSRGRPVSTLPTSPVGFGEAQRCQVTHSKVTQQINSRTEYWPSWPQPGGFPFPRAVQSQGRVGADGGWGEVAKGRQSWAALGELSGRKGGPLPYGVREQLVGSQRTQASASTWKRGLQRPRPRGKGMSFSESRVQRQALPDLLGTKPKVNPTRPRPSPWVWKPTGEAGDGVPSGELTP